MMTADPLSTAAARKLAEQALALACVLPHYPAPTAVEEHESAKVRAAFARYASRQHATLARALLSALADAARARAGEADAKALLRDAGGWMVHPPECAARRDPLLGACDCGLDGCLAAMEAFLASPPAEGGSTPPEPRP